jgi:hypothetical protein
LARETEVLGENLPECRFVHHKPHMLCPDANRGRRGGKPATNRLSYGTAMPDVNYVRFEVLTAVTMKVAVFLCVTPFGIERFTDVLKKINTSSFFMVEDSSSLKMETVYSLATSKNVYQSTRGHVLEQ